MTMIAFLYNDYYCYTPRGNFRGMWRDVDEALGHIKGGRDSNQNLELYDIDTGEWHSYKWQPTYKVKNLELRLWNKGMYGDDCEIRDYKNDGHDIEMWEHWKDYDDSKTVKYKFEWDWPTRRYGPQGNAMYDAGEWEKEL